MHGCSCSTACGVFTDQRWNPRLLHWQVDSLPLSHQESTKCTSLEEAESLTCRIAGFGGFFYLCFVLADAGSEIWQHYQHVLCGFQHQKQACLPLGIMTHRLTHLQELKGLGNKHSRDHVTHT